MPSRILLGTFLCLALAAATRFQPSEAAQAPPSTRWYKGNTHAHTVNSDGDSTPDEVVRWYREHGYNFLVLTDHNFLTGVDGLNAVHGAAEKFLVIKGEEVTSRAGDKPIHVNGLDVQHQVAAPAGTDVIDVLQRSVDGIRAARGIPHINHPNFGWAISPGELAQIERTRLFEIFNGHPHVNNDGGGGVPGLEETWDRILTSGRLRFGLAVDDAHYFKRPGDASVPGPGRGWIYVRAASLEPRTIVDAIEAGHFYSSTGVELAAFDVSPGSISVSVKPTAWSRFRVQFIGREGRVLAEHGTATARYDIRGDEGYVRVRIVESNGLRAWTQPVPIGPAGPK